jgi:hypothetical protein
MSRLRNRSLVSKTTSLNDRLAAAAAAQKAALERFQAKAQDPTTLERQVAQKAIADARAARVAERKAARDAEAARLAAEKAAREAEERRIAKEAAAAARALEAEQKARRDERYARRKAKR